VFGGLIRTGPPTSGVSTGAAGGIAGAFVGLYVGEAMGVGDEVALGCALGDGCGDLEALVGEGGGEVVLTAAFTMVHCPSETAAVQEPSSV